MDNAPTIPPELIQPAEPINIKILPNKNKNPVKIQTQPISVNLDNLLIRKPHEDETFFNMKSIYSKVAMNVFSNQINPATAILLGEMASNKAIYGVKYPEETDRVLRYIDEQIKSNY